MWPLPLLSRVDTGFHDGLAARRNQPYSSRSARPAISSRASCLSVFALRTPKPMLHCVAAAATLTFSVVACGCTGRAAAGTAGRRDAATTAVTAAPRTVRVRRRVVEGGRAVAGEAGGTGLPEVVLAVRNRSVGELSRSRRHPAVCVLGMD